MKYIVDNKYKERLNPSTTSPTLYSEKEAQENAIPVQNQIINNSYVLNWFTVHKAVLTIPSE